MLCVRILLESAVRKYVEVGVAQSIFSTDVIYVTACLDVVSVDVCILLTSAIC